MITINLSESINSNTIPLKLMYIMKSLVYNLHSLIFILVNSINSYLKLKIWVVWARIFNLKCALIEIHVQTLSLIVSEIFKGTK